MVVGITYLQYLVVQNNSIKQHGYQRTRSTQKFRKLACEVNFEDQPPGGMGKPSQSPPALSYGHHRKAYKHAIPPKYFVTRQSTCIDHGKIPYLEGYKNIIVHFVFDVKHDLRHKARLVAGGHLTDPSTDGTYSGVVNLCTM
jgi:hypothetical protein